MIRVDKKLKSDRSLSISYLRHPIPDLGIADYVRFKYGVDNPGANWSLTEFKPTQSYTNSYRITARFLYWLETHGHKGLVKKLDANLRAHTFTPEIWKTETGKSLDELWATYAENPVV